MSFQIKQSAESYDVIIVGSGAGGGMASKILSEAGLSVAVVEAGSDFDPTKEEGTEPNSAHPGNLLEEVPVHEFDPSEISIKLRILWTAWIFRQKGVNLNKI